jgi:selenocysteine lyase/cysteine desulfurase
MLVSQHALFDIPPSVCYLDGAAYSPLPRLVSAAGEHGITTKSQPWSYPEARADALAERTRAAAARLIGAKSDDVAILSSVSQGIATAARNVPLPPGHRILRMEHEFPSQSLIWNRLAAERGLVSEIVPCPADGDWTEALLTAIVRPGAPPIAVAALTPLHWSDGAVVALDRLMPLLRDEGTAVVVDATQAVGVMPIDVATLQPDFLAFPSYKWLLGPYSVGFLYAAPHRQDGLPLDENNNNRPGGIPAPGARRYDKGERNDPILLPMALAGMELVLAWGVQAVADHLRQLTDRLAQHAVSFGLDILPTELRAPHILGVRIPGGMPPGLLSALANDDVYCADRLGVLRVSPHLWCRENDPDRFGAVLGKALA